MKIYVGGVNAVGKSSLLKEAAKKLGFKYIHATTGLLQYLGFGNDYEKLRALDQSTRDVKYRKYIESLIANETESFLLDAHYLGLVRGKVDHVTASWLASFDMFVLVTAPVLDIWKRIEIDSATRDRALFPAGVSNEQKIAVLDSYQQQTVREFQKLSTQYKKPNIEIENKEGKQEDALNELVSFVLIKLVS